LIYGTGDVDKAVVLHLTVYFPAFVQVFAGEVAGMVTVIAGCVEAQDERNWAESGPARWGVSIPALAEGLLTDEYV